MRGAGKATCSARAARFAPAATFAALALSVSTSSDAARAANLDRNRQTLFTDVELRQLYAAPPSKFIDVEGTPFHVRDEGRGPVLILLNGHLGSLQMWDAWLPQLTPRFRVIRVDYAPYGLSGPDARGDYSTRHAAEQILKLANTLQLGRFHVGGTSNGALVALVLAIEHPDRVDRLVVSTLPAGRPPARTPGAEFAAAVAEQKALAPFQSRRFFAAFLHDIIANDTVIDDALIDRYWALNNRDGAKAWVDAYIQTQYTLWDTLDVKTYYARLTRPMLIQWGADGVVLPRQIGEDVAALFKGRPVRLIQYPGAGHLPMIEQPTQTVRDAIAFLSAPQPPPAAAAER